MAPDFKTQTLRVGGMSCVNCENLIRDKLRDTAGVEDVSVSYAAGTARVTYDAGKITLDGIAAIIDNLGYQASVGGELPKTDLSRAIGMLIIIAAVYIVLQQFGILNMLVPSRLADADMGYGLLFAIGLLTSVHCVAMCGGINLSQCLPKGGADGIATAKSNVKANGNHKKTAAGHAQSGGRLAVLRPSILYNLGRVASYTIVGFAAGALGSAVTFSVTAQGVLKLTAGVFMVVMGINMLNLFPRLRRLTPRMPKIFANKINAEKYRGKGPLIVGLLNGLMPCGPLQAVQIYALSTGNPIKGALAMMLFSLGTVPLMFGLGTASSVAGKKFSNKVMTAGAVMVAVLGLCMLTQGWSLFGVPIGLPLAAAPDSGKTLNLAVDLGPQVINSTLSPYGYPNIKVESGRPVKWIINAPPGSINGCNYRFIIREYGIAYEFKQGENVVEFTPSKLGNIPYTCWMGMIPGTITVVSPGSKEAMGQPSQSQPPQNGPAPAGCCRPKGAG